MSGGEGDRASLALTLALNRLSSCPILMLDESLASLDLTMKEAAIRTIRENTNTTVLVIMHDGIEGIYDATISIDEMPQAQRYYNICNILISIIYYSSSLDYKYDNSIHYIYLLDV